MSILPIPVEFQDQPTTGQLRDRMGLADEKALGWRVDLLPALIRYLDHETEISKGVCSLHPLPAEGCERCEVRSARERQARARANAEHAKRVAIEAIRKNGGRKVISTDPEHDGFTTAYISSRPRAVTLGTCESPAHSGLHLENSGCVDFADAADLLEAGVPEELVRVRQELKRADAAKMLKDRDPLDMPPWGALLEGEPFVVIRRPKVD
jgi:hypothetical protein